MENMLNENINKTLGDNFLANDEVKEETAITDIADEVAVVESAYEESAEDEDSSEYEESEDEDADEYEDETEDEDYADEDSVDEDSVDEDSEDDYSYVEANEDLDVSEEMLEVALAENEDTDTEEYALADYTESEMSGLTEQERRRREIFDKITTGILILLLASPVFIILYIFLWFIFRA